MGTIVRMLCAIALLCVGLAHKTPTAAAAVAFSSADILAYSLPDGSLPELCLPAHDEDGAKHGPAGGACEACRLVGAILVPQASDLGVVVIRGQAEPVLPRRAEAFHRQLFPPNAAPRAPPASALS
ncbi:hypothetical protein [Ensifer soli]|uniref:hypothetical protein n=1 Tax=Ciceribacter sp. sgz301302 TaxID=3342379 RepID=UPI0035B707F3